MSVVDARDQAVRNILLTFRFSVSHSNQPYGLQTAMISRIPRSVTECALKVRAELDRADEESSQASLSRHALLRHQVLSKASISPNITMHALESLSVLFSSRLIKP